MSAISSRCNSPLQGCGSSASCGREPSAAPNGQGCVTAALLGGGHFFIISPINPDPGRFSDGFVAAPVNQTACPHAVQKCAPGQETEPHRQQYLAFAATGTHRTGAYGSAEHAQIKAITQPITVQPRNRFSRKMPAASRLSRPIIAGRKYSRIMKNRVSIRHPPCKPSARSTPLTASVL